MEQKLYGSNPTPFKAYNMKLYECNIYEGDSLVRHYIPCYKRTTGEPGLYEMCNNEFFISEGTEAFIKGPDVY